MFAVKLVCFFLVLVAVSAQPGGRFEANPNDAGTVAAEKVARAKIAQISGVCDKGITVTNQKRQTVNGVIYKFTYDADSSACGGSEAKKSCDIEVVTKRNEAPFTRNESCG